MATTIFNSFFGKAKPLTITDFVSSTQSGIRVVLNKNGKDARNDGQLLRENTEIAKSLSHLKQVLKAREEAGEDMQTYTQELSVQMCQTGLMKNLLSGVALLGFEARKDVAFVFRYLLQKSSNVKDGFTVAYLQDNFDIVRSLVAGYKVADSSSACCGLMLRECARHEELAKRMLHDKCFESMFDHVQLTQFDIASDAFSTLRALLVTHKKMVAQFLEDKFEWFMGRYVALLECEQYVTKRQALRMLRDVLLDRNNLRVMTRYINQPDNLKLMMNLLRDPRKTIHSDALHMFKLFVCNPHKEKEVVKILAKNQAKLVQFLAKLQPEEGEDQLQEDLDLVTAAISTLDPDPTTPKRADQPNAFPA